MEFNTIKAITDFIFIGKKIDELKYYDLLIINADWAEKELANDMKMMFDRNIIDENTTFLICGSHGDTKKEREERDSATILIDYLNEYGFKNKIIRDDKYITNPELLKNIDKLINIDEYKSILRVAKDFVARRWYMNAKEHNFPIDRCDFYGVVDGRNIGRDTWYLSEIGIKQVMKEFVNIGEQTISGELSIK